MQKLKPFLILQAIILFFVLLNHLPYLTHLNNLFVDQLHGRLPIRPEIQIVAIDDKSLQSIGAWPWDRTVFGQLIDELNKGGAKVIGLDVFFAEARVGDEALSQSLQKSAAQVVLVNKYDFQTNQEVDTLFPENQGIANFPNDFDGKTRRTFYPNSDLISNTNPFAFQVLMDYSSPDFVTSQLPDRALSQTLYFNYTNSSFPSISFVDVIQGKTTPDQFKNKIVLVGVTTQDFKNTLDDTIIDVFGQSTPGVIIHANVINSFLHSRFQQPLPFFMTLPIAVFFSSMLFILMMTIKNNPFGFGFFIASILFSTFIGIFSFEYGVNWPFLTFISVLVSTYIYTVLLKYIQILAQRQFLQQAFEQYINPSLLKKLIDHPERLRLGGEKKEMTVMFSDVRGFTSLSEKIDPEQLVHLLNMYLDEMCEVIIDNKGTIDKFIGDAIMAFWNAPLEDTAHQNNAIKSGLMMVETLEMFNQKNHNTPLHIGIGMHTGEMVVGNVGSKKRFDYTVLGDNVNLASRIEGLTKKYGVTFLVTKQVLDGVDEDDSIIYRHIDTAIVKGKSKPIKLYEPLHNTPHNQKLKERYESGWRAYAKRQFEKAEQIWNSIQDDPTAQIMIERLPEARTLMEFNGTWEWKEK